MVPGVNFNQKSLSDVNVRRSLTKACLASLHVGALNTCGCVTLVEASGNNGRERFPEMSKEKRFRLQPEIILFWVTLDIEIRNDYLSTIVYSTVLSMLIRYLI